MQNIHLIVHTDDNINYIDKNLALKYKTKKATNY